MTSKVKTISKYKRKRSGFPGQRFSVLLADATFSNASVIFSAIHIAYIFCTPYVKRVLRSDEFTKSNVHLHGAHRRNNSRYKGFKFLLLPLFLFSNPQLVHAIPGPNHALCIFI